MDLSEKCKTKNDQISDFVLFINIPNKKYLDLIYLESETGMTVPKPKTSDSYLNYTLKGKEINPNKDSQFTIHISGYNYTQNNRSNLSNLGLNILPLYYMKLQNDERKISFLPENNQNLIVKIYSEQVDKINLNHIQYIGIKDQNFAFTKNEDSLNVILNLKWVENEKIKEYQLYYIDTCGTKTFTDITISVVSFSVERNYFVLDNNVENMKTQRLIIYGPHSDYTSINAYKDQNYDNPIQAIFDYNNNNYYLDFDQNSKGVYTFKIFNNKIEYKQIDEKIYVFNYLDELLENENLKTCSFLDNNKKDINDISYNIIIKDTGIANNISIFKSRYISNDNKHFIFTERPISTTKKEFNLNAETFKNAISTNKEVNIYLTENDYYDQPLYVFKIMYTNITLNSLFSDLIYTDADYIYFDMSCEIKNINKFYLKSVKRNDDYPLECIEQNYYSTNKMLRCKLSKEQYSNAFMRYGESLFDYGNHIITYSDKKYEICEKPFYLSHDIETADFILEKHDKQIEAGENTTVTMKTQRKTFYLPNIEKVNYNDNLGRFNPVNLNFEKVFDDNYKYIKFKIPIEKGHLYTINNICRFHCDYCRKGDCWNNTQNYTVFSNTKKINYTLNRKYISLYDSKDLNYNKHTDLIIKFEDEDKEKLVNLIMIYTPENGGESKQTTINIKNNNYEIKRENLATGKYEFKYTIKEEGESEEEFDFKNKVVLVVNHYYEIFNLNEITKYCIYFNNTNNELLTSISKNETYKFKDYVILSDIIIVINGIVFEYSENTFKKYPTAIFQNNKEYDFILLKEKEYQNLIFTKIVHSIKITGIDLNSSIPYFYKDNIVTYNQICNLDNIYIKLDSEIDYYNLNCHNFDNSKNKAYCETSYKFINSKSNIFKFYIGITDGSKINYFDIGRNKLIYNSIKDSLFDLSYDAPIVTISSENFNMSHIYFSEIDNETRIYSDSFKPQNDKLIQFEFVKSNDTLIKNYVTNLFRIDHQDDLPNTVKNNPINLEIASRKCKNYERSYMGGCFTCDVLSKLTAEFANRIWYQNNDCVTQCNFGDGYGIHSKKNHICIKCNNNLRTKIGDDYFCGCLLGTVKSFEDDNCYLPESDEIKNLLIQKKNANCYREDGITHNYCNNATTENCVPYSFSGFLFPQCICKEGFIGKYCEYDNNIGINLTEKMETILDDENNNNPNEVDETNIVVISNIRGIIFFIEKDGDKYIKNIPITSINLYINNAIQNLKRIVINDKNTTSQIFDVLELAIYFLKYKITNSQRLRNLQDGNIQNDKEHLKYILNYTHYAHFYGNKVINQNYNIQTDGLGLTSFITYKKDILNSDDFKYEMANTTLFKIIEYIDINTTRGIDTIYVTLINNTLFDEIEENNDLGIRAYFSTNNSLEEDLDLRNNTEIIFYISSLDIHFNFDLAQYYQDRKINIYDKKDKAFVDPCFLSKNFDFDLTQKYRKNNVFQKTYFGNDFCEYISFESKYNRVAFTCSQFEKIEKVTNSSVVLYYGVLSININKDTISNANKVYNLPTKCTRKIDNVGGNMAFWLFLIICALEIFYIIGINILTLGSLKKISFRKGLYHDELYRHISRNENRIEFDSNSHNEKLAKTNEQFNQDNKNFYKTSIDKIENSKEIGIDKFYKTLVDCIIFNFKELHPVAVLWRVSVISPLIINSWFFVFNSLILFGFNALLYYESLIEKRIYDKKRNYFDYPMRKEFHKIILSILCQVAITTLIKLLMMVRLYQRNDLKMNLTKCYLKGNEEINNDIVVKVEQFQDQMFLRRIIGGAIMLCGVVFFFYYSVAFCGVYINTQKNWFYSGIWSLFWNWIIFAPIYIVIISILENKKQDSYNPLVYNLKRLFCF